MKKKYIERLLNDRWGLVLAFTISVLVNFLPIIGILYLCVRLSDFIKVGETRIQRLFVAFLLFLTANAFLYEIFNLCNVHPSIILIGFTYTIFGFLIPRIGKESVQIVSSGDFLCLIAAFISFVYLLMPVYLNRGVGYSVATLHLISSGEDNASHFSLYKHSYVNKGYAYSKTTKNKGLIPTLVNYPQGSEFTMSFLTRSIIGDNYQNANSRLIEAYYLMCAIFFSMFVFSITLIANRLYSAQARRKIRMDKHLPIILISVGLITIGPLLSLMSRGFQSQIYAYIFLVCLLFLLIDQERGSDKKLGLLYSMVIWGGISTSWWYLAPIAVAPILLFIYKNYRFISIKYSAGISPIFLLGIYPIILSRIADIKTGSLNDVGGLDHMSVLILILYTLPFIALIIKRTVVEITPIMITFLAWAGFTLLIGLYQISTVGHLGYYFYKSTYTLIPLGAVLAIYISLLVLDRFIRSQSVLLNYILSLSFIFIMVASVYYSKPVYPRVYLNDWFNNLSLPSDYSYILQKSQENKYSDLLVIGGCNNPATYIENRWSGAIFLSEDSGHSNLELSILKDTPKGVVSAINGKGAHDARTFIYAKPECLDPFLSKMVRLSGLATNLEY